MTKLLIKALHGLRYLQGKTDDGIRTARNWSQDRVTQVTGWMISTIRWSRDGSIRGIHSAANGLLWLTSRGF